MILSHIQLNENLEEKILHMTPDFPYICCHVEMDKYPSGYIPWHWHDEVELIYVQKGSVEYHIKDTVVKLDEGDGCFMNSNVLHLLKPSENCEGSVLLAHTFKKLFLSGFYNSIFEQKYIDPIVNCKNLEYYRFKKEKLSHEPILKKMKIAYDLAEAQPYGYEFTVRDLLSSLWLLLLEEVQPIVNKKKIKSSVENERIKAMISYIQANYPYKLTVEDIAASANISDRVCYRCFMRNIGMTPVEYLLQCRIRAAEDLLTGTSKSITEISTLVGFNNGSYFGKAFQAILHCSPKEYRKRNLTS